MGVYCLDLVTPGTYLHNTMDETDIIHALNQYVEKIYYTNHTYLFGSILVYGSLLCLSSAHVMKQEISKGRNYFCFKYDKTDDSYQP
jgi:hypothetical protein